MWRGETFAATAAEYYAIKTQLASETFAAEAPGGPPRFYSQLPQEERAKLLKDRLKKYCQRVRGAGVKQTIPCPSRMSSTSAITLQKYLIELLCVFQLRPMD